MTYKGAEYIDLMGVKRTPVVDGEFPVSPFPLFIRGKTGDAEAFIKAISTSVIKGANKLPFRISDELGSPDTLKLVLSNELARPIAGTLRMAGETYKIEIGKISSQTIAVKLPKPVSSTTVDEIRIPMVCEVDGQTFKSEFKTHAFAAKRFTGDWSAIPSITLKNPVAYKKSDERRGDKGDFEAKFQIAWDDAKLYLRVLVIDDIFTPGNTPGNRYDYDVAQVYLDTRCSARKTGKTVYDDDDYDYSLMPTPDGKNCEVFRALSPFIQYTLGIAAPKDGVIATEIPSKFTRTADGYIYEAEFPAAYILPAQLKPNYNMGFGLYVADRDGGNEVKQGLSLATEPGKGCYNNPQLWPLMILTE